VENDDEIDETDGDDPEDYEDDGDDDDSSGSPASEGAWLKRRAVGDKEKKTVLMRSKLTWEEKYEDDPLRADSPTRDYEKEVIPFEKTFVVIGETSGSNALEKRDRAWLHHMQWVRRLSLVPDQRGKVVWEFTRLSSDRMYPTAQVIGIRANDSTDISSLLASEPLAAVGAVNKWSVYEYSSFDHENVTWDSHDPNLFIGIEDAKGSKKLAEDSPLYQQHLDYHMAHGDGKGRRVIAMGRLASVTGQRNGIFLLFNARTDAEAQRYLAADPLVKGGVFGSSQQSMMTPVNEQDVNGLHHLMARSFAEKTVLDQVRLFDL
jgi:uncharacterized protein YciI